MTAVNCAEDTNVVARVLPFHCTMDACVKFDPLTVRVNPPLPTITAFGVRADNTGGGGGV